MKRVYLDNAATTPIRKEVVDAMLPFLQDFFGNPSSTHAEGRKVRAAIEDARKMVAEVIGASIGEIFFTSGGTESNNMALKCAVRDLGVRLIITSPTEHHCILHTIESLQKAHGVEVKYLDIDTVGRIDYAQLRSFLAAAQVPTMVSVMHGNNEIGTMIDLNEVATICSDSGAFFHSDTVQTVGHFPIDVSKTKMSFLSGAAHKIHGPKGVGFIYINGDNQVNPLIDGGGQERNMRGGTENVAGIIGLAHALQIAAQNLEQESIYVRRLRNRFLEQLQQLYPEIQLHGDFHGASLDTVCNVSFPKSEKSDLLVLLLDMAGICVSGGSACSSGAEKRSHVVEALRIESGRKNVRFSFSHMNTIDDVDLTISKMKEILPAEVVA